jgi:hypothetical protein
MSIGQGVIDNEGEQMSRSYVMVTVFWCGVDMAYINVGKSCEGGLTMHRKGVGLSGCNGP